MKANWRSVRFTALFALQALTPFLTTKPATAQETVLYNFTGASDGGTPRAPLISDSSGNFYGTTLAGGAYGWGTVFELSPRAGGGWTESVLHSFQSNLLDGVAPWSGVVFDATGNLYGTAYAGGIHNYGIVFELSPQAGGGWIETVLHNFKAGDGQFPTGGLIFDTAGSLYGTTTQGGAFGEGVVFKLSQTGGAWTETVLHSFNPNGPDGQVPSCTLILDTAGNLYGTTTYGGTFSAGTVFELSPNSAGGWTERRLANFGNSGNNPYLPSAGLVFDPAGNLYTTLTFGGLYSEGAVVELSPKAGGGWTTKAIHNFNGTDGHEPLDSLIIDSAGNLYGTTYAGGANGGGVAFELSPRTGGVWVERTLHSFACTGTTNCGEPYASLVFDALANLYGTTSKDGTGSYGTVFKIAH
jgi:uncharacterized repeat protein (TIGR03803 family)